MKVFEHKIFKDARFWIVLFFVIRLVGITNAPLESAHNWRQSFTNMVARNFLEVDNNILYPRVDMDGNKDGIVASEFPLFNYLIYLISEVFSYTHWYGRLINLIISSFGIFYFYKSVKLIFKDEVAFYASLSLLSSLWFAYSRKSMPDTFCMSLVIIGIYHALLYYYGNNIKHLLLFFVFASIGVLCKIPALYLLSILALPLFQKNILFKRKLNILITGLLILIATYVWYFYWDPYLLSLCHVELYYPKTLVNGFWELVKFMPETLEKFYFAALESYVAFVLFLLGIFLIIKNKQINMLLIFAISTLFFVLFISKTGFVFSTHSYYVIPYVPVMSLVVGFAFSQLKNPKIKTILIIAIVVEGIINVQHDFRIKNSELYKLRMNEVANKVSKQHDLFVINGGQSPQQIYFLHRKGWSETPENISNSHYLDSLKQMNCKYIFINKNNNQEIHIPNTKKKLFDDKDFMVFEM